MWFVPKAMIVLLEVDERMFASVEACNMLDSVHTRMVVEMACMDACFDVLLGCS